MGSIAEVVDKGLEKVQEKNNVGQKLHKAPPFVNGWITQNKYLHNIFLVCSLLEEWNNYTLLHITSTYVRWVPFSRDHKDSSAFPCTGLYFSEQRDLVGILQSPFQVLEYIPSLFYN